MANIGLKKKIKQLQKGKTYSSSVKSNKTNKTNVDQLL